MKHLLIILAAVLILTSFVMADIQDMAWPIKVGWYLVKPAVHVLAKIQEAVEN